ncbi:MAG: hypothetical protein O7G87_17320 [bacterium]|nr:hypothetical protein [bacterium]
MTVFVQAEKDFEASMKHSRELSKRTKVRMEKSRQLNDELEHLVEELAELCVEKGLKV